MGHDIRYKTRDSLRNGQAVATNNPWSEAGSEPKLADVLADPMVHLVMRRDGLQRADVEAAVAFGQRQLRRRLCSANLCCAA